MYKDIITQIATQDLRPELIKAFESRLSRCNRCVLHKTRENVVIGKGSYDADLMFIGEGPSEFEDIQGIPFVGKAGQELDKALKYIERFDGKTYKDVFITNSVLCRSPENRNPLYNEEIMACNPRLQTQIYLIKSKIIFLLGTHALRSIAHLMNIEYDHRKPLKDYFDQTYELKLDNFHCNVIISYHPSAWLRKSEYKQISIEHWKKLKDML